MPFQSFLVAGCA